ncbi:glycosyltransferase family 2 protein [bacterium]|nr:glycosyltransferase family 2 protein [bacterium]
MSQLPDIAVLVLNYNGLSYLEKCFMSLSKQTYPRLKVYLVDNGSTDASMVYTRTHFPRVEIIPFARNLGFTEAYNRAVELISEPLVVFLNNDTECAPDWLEQLYRPMRLNAAVAAVGSRMVFASDPNLLNHGGGYFTYAGIGLDRDYGRAIDEPDLPREPFLTAYACGGAALVRRDVFLEVGAFSNEYFIYFEDVDLCYRIWLAGYEVMHAPDSVVTHFFSPVFGQESPAKIFLCQKNRLANIVKHFSCWSCLKALLVSTGYDLRRSFIWWRNGQSAYLSAVCRGYLHFLGTIPRLLAERRSLQRTRTRSDTQLVSLGLFLNVSQSFNELKRLQNVKSRLLKKVPYEQ